MGILIANQLVHYVYILQIFGAILIIFSIKWYLQIRDDNQTERNLIKKALLVDDDPDIRRLCEKILSKYGVEVVSVDNGQCALRMVDELFDFDILITDIYMPHMDGIELSSHLHDKLPILIISSGPKNALLKHIYANSDGHINKKHLSSKLYQHAVQAIQNWKTFHKQNRDAA